MEVEMEEKRLVVTDGIDERERRRLLVRTATDSISTIHNETAAWHDRVKEIEDKKIGCREGVHESETELATIEVRAANIVERIEDQYKGTFRELVRSIDPDAIPKELEMDEGVFQVSQATSILEDGRRKIGSLGAVNHLAVEEYEQKNERFNFLEEQLADVEKARSDLTSTISQINRTASDMFQTTFDEVRKNYIAVFQTLFNGGRADLLQLRTDDPLESQIKVVAQPKGKRVDQIRLLSGGERCMTALALLFAVYLVKPSPFCLLDEADAPLDDENVTRFVKMLEEFSKSTQFLVVTHNKLTMEAANHLYGITMMEKGVSSLVSVNFQDVADATDDDLALGKVIAARRHEIDLVENEISSEEADALIAKEEKSRITMEAGE
jgi:chromosome segregation protein